MGAGAARRGDNFGRALHLHGDLAIIGSEDANTRGVAHGAAFIYSRTAGSWVKEAILLASDGAHTDNFGSAVAISGTTAVAGAWSNDANGLPNAGSVYVFERQGGAWPQVAKLIAADATPSAHFGWSVAIDGDTLVVGAEEEGQGGFASGAAYVFERIGGLWAQVQKLVPNDLDPGDGFGRGCAIQGDRIVVGAPSSNGLATNAGKAYVYERDAGGWTQTSTLEAWDGEESDFFAWGIDIDGDRVAIGSIAEDDGAPVSGAIYVFEHRAGSWVPVQKLNAPDPELDAMLGVSVALDGPYLLAGAHTDDHGIGLDEFSSTGSAYLFRHDGTSYVFERKIREAEPTLNDFFGWAVALSGTTALIGVENDDDTCPEIPMCNSGSAWFHEIADFAHAYCFGLGCPCGNDDPARGCANSSGTGAQLTACGSGSVALDDAGFGASGLEPGLPALLFRARDALGGGAGLPFGDGLRCAGTEARRLGIRWPDALGTASWGPGLAILGGWQPGDTFRFRVLYRDLPSSPCTTRFNTTNALEASFVP